MMTLPDGLSVWLVQDLRSRMGFRDAVNTVWGGRTRGGEEEPDLRCKSYSMIRKTFSGCLLDVIIVVTPAAVDISAAMSLVSIPPVPRLEPSVVVLTTYHEKMNN